jgi:hypothetical protein
MFFGPDIRDILWIARRTWDLGGGGGAVTISGQPISERLQDATSAQLTSVTQQHLGDNQVPPAGGGAVLTAGVTALTNAIGNTDRLRETGIDQQPAVGIQSGAASFAQEVLTTSTTTVLLAAANANLVVTTSTGFKVGGVLNFEPGTANYEGAVITAIPDATHVTVAFGVGGAKFAHNQPYTVQTFLLNQERDFAGELQTAGGTGAAIAAEYEDNSGGPIHPTTGLPTGLRLDSDRNIQGKAVVSAAITATLVGDTNLVFTANPWVAGLLPGHSIILSVTAAGAPIETVVVSKDNTAQTGATLAARTVKLAYPVTNAASAFAMFDAYGLLGVFTGITGATVMGVEDSAVYVYDSAAPDPKRPLYPMQGTQGVLKINSSLDGVNNRFAGSGQNGDGNNGSVLQAVASYIARGDGNWDRLRTPVVFKTAAVTGAGSTALWTPAAGKKFRLLRYMVIVTDQATLAAGATLTIDLLDAAGTLAQTHSVFVPNVGLTGGAPLYVSPWVDLGNGILSATANNVLNVNLSAALTAGICRILVCGTEE